MRVFPSPRIIGRALVALFVLVFVLAGQGCAAPPETPSERAPKNIIILFGDGAAPMQWDFGRYTSAMLRGQPFVTTDTVFREGVLGLLATDALGAYVADSAAAASAMSTGHKTVNGAISVTPEGKPQRTVMQAAKAAGKRVGLVTTAAVYDATPAAFSINARSRNDARVIVDAMFDLEPDVLMGGGARLFLPVDAPGGRRKDGKDLIAGFKAKGYAVARNTEELKSASGARILGLFADYFMSYELDRDPVKEPSTAEMADAALKALSRDNAKGFVLLIENENIDNAGHANDAASLMRALWAFDDAVKVALEFQRRHPDTLLIVTGDHETGGFSPTQSFADPLNWRRGAISPATKELELLAGITMSFGRAAEMLRANPGAGTLDALLAKHFPGFRLDPDLREALLERRPIGPAYTYLPQNAFGVMVARQTGFYWGTSAHTPQPVAVGALGPGARLFHGYQHNSDFGKHLQRLLAR